MEDRTEQSGQLCCFYIVCFGLCLAGCAMSVTSSCAFVFWARAASTRAKRRAMTNPAISHTRALWPRTSIRLKCEQNEGRERKDDMNPLTHLQLRLLISSCSTTKMMMKTMHYCRRLTMRLGRLHFYLTSCSMDSTTSLKVV